MTQEEREAGNEVVARAMGYERFKGHWIREIATGTEMLADCPDLYANTDAGAMARERAEDELRKRGLVNTTKASYSRWVRPLGELFADARGANDTEARAAAIIAAFQAISEGNRAE